MGKRVDEQQRQCIVEDEGLTLGTRDKQVMADQLTAIRPPCDLDSRIVSLKWRSRQPNRPEALGLHGFVTHTTKDIQEMRERMLTWQL